MRRQLLPALVYAVVLPLLGCSHGVQLGQQYQRLPDNVEVAVIDAMEFTRAQFEDVLADHEILARFNVFVPDGADFEEKLARELEQAKGSARRLGGDALMYTRDSEVVAAIAQDARYAGPNDAIVVYALRRRRER